MPRILRFICLFILSLILVTSASAQWTTQTLSLNAGWNVVFLEVEPYPAQCDSIFGDIPVASVWTYDQRFSSVEFIQDLSELTSELPQWRRYFPPGDSRAFTTNLFILEAGRAYLIEATQATVWNVVGKPRMTRQQWKPGEYNFAGFWVDPGNPPTFSDWFSGSTSHQPLDIWGLDTAGVWRKVTNTTTSRMSRGRAYWVFCSEQSDFQGPVEIRLSQGTSLEYGLTIVEQTLEFKTVASSTRTLTINRVTSEAAPDSSVPSLCGAVPLAYYGKIVQDAQNFSYGYSDLPAALTVGSSDPLPKLLRVAVERSQMTPATGEGLYQSLLEVKSDKGFRRYIGVTAEGASSIASKSSLRQAASDPAAGLWVGNVVLNKVNNAGLKPSDTADTFEYRIMIHVDSQGTARLLNEVTQLFRPGQIASDPQEPALDVVEEPGRYILYTPSAPQALVNEIGTTILPGTLRDGRPFARRISTAAYSLLNASGKAEEPILASTGAFGATGTELTTTLVIEDTETTNPFHHKYHPQHGWSEYSPDWTVNWQMSFTFTEESPDGRSVAGWGDSQVGGDFEQILTGLVKEQNSIRATGYFLLQRASIVAQMNDGM